MSGSPPHVVILGGGFGGLAAATALARAPVRLTLVDRKNHHTFQPLLYQVATAALAAPDIAAPLRQILRAQANCTVVLAEATAIDPGARRVVLADGELAYDHLILATGATHSYFGNDAWAAHAPGLKTVEDAFEIRRRVLLAYESAEREDDPDRRRAWLTFAVIGGGPTGAELAGALAEIARHTLARDFRRCDPRSARVVLLEGADRILGAFPPALSESARRQLEALGVEVRLGARVTGIDAEGVSIGAERLVARTVIWAAGVAASPLAASLGVARDRAGRVLVEPDLSIPGHPEVAVIGDLAAVKHGEGWVPGVAPAAMQMGALAARNLLARLAGRPTEAFAYVDKGSMATIGRAAGIAKLGRLELSGLAAWLMWLLVHVFFLIGFRNRLVVMFEWAMAYFTYGRSARVILTGPPVDLRAAGEGRVAPSGSAPPPA